MEAGLVHREGEACGDTMCPQLRLRLLERADPEVVRVGAVALRLAAVGLEEPPGGRGFDAEVSRQAAFPRIGVGLEELFCGRVELTHSTLIRSTEGAFR
ncbi:MAG: hypothetical protein RL514_4564 [Verrucomicrobiota bacterium]|jgi:hypothetical protein